MRVLDLGRGWGGFLAYVREIGIAGIGITLSSRQAAACRLHGLEVYEADCREIRRDDFGVFDGLVSLGAFEHFCPVEQWPER
jgi:cyclopropane-fatty-acyl-phospholipid synthase